VEVQRMRMELSLVLIAPSPGIFETTYETPRQTADDDDDDPSVFI
jgi:hypothetical protein